MNGTFAKGMPNGVASQTKCFVAVLDDPDAFRDPRVAELFDSVSERAITLCALSPLKVSAHPHLVIVALTPHVPLLSATKARQSRGALNHETADLVRRKNHVDFSILVLAFHFLGMCLFF